jgi:TRAP-type mannitol/chloroaromatic compound transport system permease small subunit
MDGFFIGGEEVFGSPSVIKQVAAILWGKKYLTIDRFGLLGGAAGMLLKIEYFFQRSSRLLGRLLAIVFLLMTVNVFFDVVMRYFFRNSSVGMQEMEWHLFSIVILFGVSVALLEEGHVRVDFLYDRFSIRKKAVINIIGTVFFLTPLACLILFGSFDFVLDSYNIKEISENPGGLHYRFIIKAMIPLAFALLIFFAIGYTVQNINLYRQGEKPHILSQSAEGESK